MQLQGILLNDGDFLLVLQLGIGANNMDNIQLAVNACGDGVLDLLQVVVAADDGAVAQAESILGRQQCQYRLRPQLQHRPQYWLLLHFLLLKVASSGFALFQTACLVLPLAVVASRAICRDAIAVGTAISNISIVGRRLSCAACQHEHNQNGPDGSQDCQ